MPFVFRKSLIQYNNLLQHPSPCRCRFLFRSLFAINPKSKTRVLLAEVDPLCKETTFETPTPESLIAQKPQTGAVYAGIVHDRIVFAHMLLLVSIAKWDPYPVHDWSLRIGKAFLLPAHVAPVSWEKARIHAAQTINRHAKLLSACGQLAN